MSRVTVTEAIRRAGRLIPVQSASVRGDYAAVCSPVDELPQQFRQAHLARHHTYMATGDRSSPGFAPRYIVTYRRMPIAWVNLDGTTHFAEALHASDMTYGGQVPMSNASIRAAFRRAWQIQAELERAWPERFDMDSMGDPVLPRP